MTAGTRHTAGVDDLPAADHAARRDRLRPALQEAEVDLLLVTAPANVRYLTGFTGSNGQVLVAATAAGDRLVTDPRYEERAAAESPGLPLSVSRDPVAVALDAVGDKRLGFEARHVSWKAGERLVERAADAGATGHPTDDLVEELRVTKDDAEIARLEVACRITVDALLWLFDDQVAPGRTERDLAIALERRLVDLGAEAPAFPSIVAGGPASAVPHHAPSARPLEPGDLLTVDCGARVDGYHADCTRTVAVGHLDDRLVAVYEVVRDAQAAARAAAVAGATAGDVDAAAREPITEAGYGDAFVHGTGHGVGLEVHEAPAVTKGAPATLGVGTALTVEPGVYLPGAGGVRIEDTIVVAADGPRPLTTAPRELHVL